MDELNKMNKLLGDKIRQLRTEQNLTQEKLSEKSDLHSSYIGLIERAEKSPSIETLQKVAVALNVSIADLFIEENKWKDADRKRRELFNVIKNKSAKQIDTLIKVSKVIFT